MVRYLIVLTLLLGAGQLLAQTSRLQGKVMDENLGGEAVPFANIVLQKGGEQVAGTTTDLDGNYNFANIQPGTYTVLISYVGLPNLRVENLLLLTDKVTVRDFTFPKQEGGIIIPEIVVEDTRPILEVDQVGGGSTRTADEIKTLGTRNITDVQAMTARVQTKDTGEKLNAMGSRSTSNDVYVDGVRMNSGGGFGVAETDIEQIQVMTTGISAEYGDATGAITSIVTKGPSNKFTGGVQMETSQFLDAFASNRVDMGFSGPIWKKPLIENGKPVMKNDSTPQMRTIIGYRFAGTVYTSRDERPSALGSYKLKDDVLEQIQANPLVKNPDGTRVLAADYLTADDFEKVKVRPNTRESYSFLNGKLEFKPNNEFFIVAGFQGQFNWGKSASGLDRVFNYQYNPVYYSSDYRFYGRLRHTIGSTVVGAEASDTVAKVFQNFSYEIQADYSRIDGHSADPRYGDHLFEYGYVGKIYRHLVPTVGPVDTVFIRDSRDSIVDVQINNGHLANYIQFDGYTPANDINPQLAAYNNLVDFTTPGVTTSMEQMEIVNGRFVGNRASVYGLYNNSGYTGSDYGKSNSTQFRANVKANFDLVTRNAGGTPMRHSIQMGGVYEQRVARSYNISPFELWTLADQSANDHLTFSADRSRPTGETFYDPFTQRYYDKYEALVRQDAEGNTVPMTAFGERVRDMLNQTRGAENQLTARDWVNVHEIDPSQLQLSMFDPTTLIQGRSAVMGYYGYDYLGNPLGTSVQFNDFFTEKDAAGRKTRPIAPFKPIYVAGYVQNKFTYKDIIVRMGVRVESYDANTKVLKDPFSVAGYYTASEFKNAESPYTVAHQAGFAHPSNIGDNYAVYVNENSPDASVVGYRNGEQWYNAQGIPVNEARQLGTNFIPALRGFSTAENDAQGDKYNPDLAFRDYKPTVNVMPRLAFSFPIGELANFYANYDVLAQRPAENSFASPLTYFNFREQASSGAYLPNPNLRSQRTINYEVGYQQALTKSSKFKISVLYREDRNLIQLKQYLFAYPIQYYTFGNDDFSTTKSFSLEYEMQPRKKKGLDKPSNIRIIANYTLQFAEGTGSSPTTSAAIAAKDLKYVFPLDFDTRHYMNFNFDYRFKSGSDYNGPLVGKNSFPLLENTGLNIGLTTYSGSPYTRKQIPGGIGTSFPAIVTEGSINGARLPWTFRIDARLDRDIVIGKDSKNPIRINVYLRVQNLLNTQNVLAVYPATGSPTDDGFLTMQNSQGPTLLQAVPASYSTLYNLRMNNPFNISRPRRIYLGLKFNF